MVCLLLKYSLEYFISQNLKKTGFLFLLQTLFATKFEIKMRKFLTSFLIIFPLFLSAQKYTDNQIKSAFVLQFAQNIEWKKDKVAKNFVIALYGNDTSMLPDLRRLQSKKVAGKPIKVEWYNQMFQLKDKKINLLYIAKDKNYEIKDIYYNLYAQNILFVSDNNKQQIYIMLNFIEKDNKISFEVNKKTIEEQELKILPNLLVLGGTELDVRELYKLKEEELKREQAKVKEGQELIAKQTAEIEAKKKEIEEQKAEIVKQKNEIIYQKEQIEEQVKKLAVVQEDVKKQHELLQEKIAELSKQEALIGKQQKDIEESQKLLDEQNAKVEERNKILQEQEAKIEEHKKLIANQENTLISQKGTINSQKGWIIAMAAVILLVLILTFLIFRSLRQNRKMNKELEVKNVAILQKTQEVESQAEELRAINEELEKLSIVASETDNAVVIMNEKGDFEWVNDGFTRLYGFTFAEMISKFGKNIKATHNTRDFDQKVDDCINNKKTVIYENHLKTKDGKDIWVQTTMTPILDIDGSINKLVAIDTDINRIKEAEHEIQQKNSELTAQRDELAQQKEHIEEQNTHIRSSINYGKTIQSAILPAAKDMQTCFKNYFILYKPKDIVSGDFYWFARVKENDKFVSFYAAVDCTGHGVPGAFMSMIGSRLLNEIVTEKRVTSPKEILTKLNEKIIKALRQKETDNRDGMDMCFVRVDKTESGSQITFTGAKRDLFFYKKEHEIERIKGDRKSIGGILEYRTKPMYYTNQIVKLQKGDTIYLTTDGYIDQNNPARKRYGTTKFISFLETIKDQKLEDQKKNLDNELLRWQDGEEQRDDITVIALKE